MDLVKARLAWATATLLCITSSGVRSANTPQYCGTAQWQSLIVEAAARFALPEPWLHAVMRVESTGCALTASEPTTSSAGAMGLMQLMPAVWDEQRERLQLGDDPHDPRDNILAGAAYLHDLFDRYGWPGAIAAYHAGPARYEKYLSTGEPLPHATLDYLTRIENSLSSPGGVPSPALLPSSKKSAPLAPAHRSLFVARESSKLPEAHQPTSSNNDSLFVPLREADTNTTRVISERP